MSAAPSCKPRFQGRQICEQGQKDRRIPKLRLSPSRQQENQGRGAYRTDAATATEIHAPISEKRLGFDPMDISMKLSFRRIQK